MSYDPEKYRKKREKVMGVRRRGIRFRTLTILVTAFILGGLGLAGLPGAYTYLQTRNLDDAIFKLDTPEQWPQEVLARLRSIEGVRTVDTDTTDTRLVVSFDRTRVGLDELTAVFHAGGVDHTLLNRMDHRHRAMIKSSEEKME